MRERQTEREIEVIHEEMPKVQMQLHWMTIYRSSLGKLLSIRSEKA